MVVLSKNEKQFLEDVRKGDLSRYTALSKRQYKHRILKKRKQLTSDLLVINELLEKLEAV